MSLSEKMFLIDFPDQYTADTYGKNLYNTAKILGLEYRYSASEFGEKKYHFKVFVKGTEKSIEDFSRFIDESTKLVEDITVQHRKDIKVADATYTAEEVKNMQDPVLDMCDRWKGIAEDWQRLEAKSHENWKKSMKGNAIIWFLMLASMFYLVFMA